MKPQKLPIKKHSVIYDDAEAARESEPFRPNFTTAPSRRAVRRRRVGPSSALFPLLVIAAGLFIFFKVIPHAPTARAVAGDWQVTLHVTPYQDQLIVGITFLSRSGRAAADPPEAAVRISLTGTGEQVFVAGDLARSPMTLSGRLPNLQEAVRVQAEVSIQGTRVTLAAPVPRKVPLR
jgi:hypothetical protein